MSTAPPRGADGPDRVGAPSGSGPTGLRDTGELAEPATPDRPVTQPADAGRIDSTAGSADRPDQGLAAYHRRRRGRRIRALAGVVALVVVALVAGVVARGIGGNGPSTPQRSRLPPATTTVTRATLTQTELVNGTLGYGDAVTLSVPAAAGAGSGNGGGSGTITWLPRPGSVVARGKPAYKVDDKPVPLIYGTLPLYRALNTGVIGADVKELEQNLAALGYTGFTVDDTYTAATATAVKQLQADLGLAETGSVDPRQVAVAPDAIRIASLKASLGSASSGPVLTYAGTTRVVTIALDVAMQSLVKVGIPVTVTLPDGKVVNGTVRNIGTVASGGDSGSDSDSDKTTIDVVVALADQKALGRLDDAPVSVTLISGQAKDVLTVPVEALVALAEGGYGVQVVDGSTSHYVPVKTGMFANGKVEITGDGITAGMVVGVAA